MVQTRILSSLPLGKYFLRPVRTFFLPVVRGARWQETGGSSRWAEVVNGFAALTRGAVIPGSCGFATRYGGWRYRKIKATVGVLWCISA